MKNLTRSSILLGLGLLTASNFVTVPASAQPHVLKDQKKHDKHDRIEDRRDDRRNNNRPGWNNGRPGNWNNGRPGNWNNGRPQLPRVTTIEGRVLNNTRGNDFELRVNGRTVRVMAYNGEPRGLSRGDTVRATGRYEGGTFRASRVTITHNGRR